MELWNDVILGDGPALGNQRQNPCHIVVYPGPGNCFSQQCWCCPVITIDLAQLPVGYATDTRQVQQTLIAETLGQVAQAAKQREPVPVLGLLQAVMPGTGIVMFQYRAVGFRIGGMLNSPFVE
ncbi:hypothetical protein D9M73_179800 [compost metagenome]